MQSGFHGFPGSQSTRYGDPKYVLQPDPGDEILRPSSDVLLFAPAEPRTYKGMEGRYCTDKTVVCLGPSTVTLADDDPSIQEGLRFLLGGFPLTLNPGDGVRVIYDPVTNGWRTVRTR